MDRNCCKAWMATSVWLILFAGAALAQPGGSELMLAGNESFRAGNYVEARDAYRQALASGFDSALLRYNLGIAHYRLGEYAEAELALERAAGDPALAPLATYNLGLTSLAAGWLDAAETRFERVRTIAGDAALAELAGRALDRVSLRRDEAIPAAASRMGRQPWREPDPPIGDLYFVIAARYGTDDNVYRAPSSPYVDLTQPGQPTITPEQQSAGYMPVDMLVHYRIDSAQQNTLFDFAYRMNGDFYDSAFANANVLTQRFEIGAEVLLEGDHARSLDTTFFGVTHDETNFDPDTGADRAFRGEDISSRFSYRGAGIESAYEHVMNRWAFGFDTRIERRSYEDVQLVTRYDHEFYHLDLWTERRIGSATSLLFAVQSYRREYDARSARDAAGILSTANPTLEYTYSAADVGAERYLGDTLSLHAGYRRVERSDNFEGYADYSQDMLRVGLDYEPTRRMQLELSVWARTYEYPNAFAFNDPIGGPLEIDSTDAVIDFEFRINPGFSIWSEFLLIDESSTDPRLNYARNRAIVGLKWRH